MSECLPIIIPPPDKCYCDYDRDEILDALGMQELITEQTLIDGTTELMAVLVERYRQYFLDFAPVNSFNNGSGDPVDELKIKIEPVQEGSGTPAPDNIRPISGWERTVINISKTPPVYTQNNAPYLERQSLGIGNHLTESLVGGSVAWNQLINPNFTTSSSNGLTFTNNADGSITVDGTAQANSFKGIKTSGLELKQNHVYYNRGYKQPENYAGGSFNVGTIAPDTGNGKVYKRTTADTTTNYRLDYKTGEKFNNMTLYPQWHDLTLMFGTPIADYVYTLEQGTTGAGIQWLKSYGFFTDSYYPFDACSIQSVHTSNHSGYALDPIDLRGLPKLDNGNLYYDGDVYEFDGTVTRDYGEEDLGSKTWQTTNPHLGIYWIYTLGSSTTGLNGKYVVPALNELPQGFLAGYTPVEANASRDDLDKIWWMDSTQKYLGIKDTACANYTTAQFKAFISGTKIMLKRVQPITETASSFTEVQDVPDTEYYTDNRTVPIPVGHESEYWDADEVEIVNWEDEAGTVYGGELNVTTGVLTVTWGYIASYNGETLPGEWVSDRDAYVAGTTPTTGAEVAYELADPIVYQLTPEEVSTLLGQNYVWADTGDNSITYT